MERSARPTVSRKTPKSGKNPCHTRALRDPYGAAAWQLKVGILRREAMANLPRGILFDMDDTILAVSGSARVVWKRITAEFAAALAPLPPENVATAIEAQSQLLWNDTAWNREWRVRLGEARRQIVARAF